MRMMMTIEKEKETKRNKKEKNKDDNEEARENKNKCLFRPLLKKKNFIIKLSKLTTNFQEVLSVLFT